MNYPLRNLPHRLRGWRAELLSMAEIGLCSKLSAKKYTKRNGILVPVKDYGILGRRVVTDAGVNFLVDAFQNLTELEAMSWHASGTGTTAEATGDTALVTEVESRVDGSQTEGASPNIYQTVATISYTSSLAITEHGLFDANVTGTLWDRTVFAAINVVSGDAIEFTYELTASSGG